MAVETGKETYLGDGLYASFDGFMIILRAPRGHGDHYVALEPDVMVKLLRWIAHAGHGLGALTLQNIADDVMTKSTPGT